MAGELVTPNWHIILIHYPLALISVGVIAELLGVVIRRAGLRAAARWMILLGALSTIPTALTGLYAFRDVVVPGAGEPQLMPWHDVVAQSDWDDERWEIVDRHIWLNAPATLFLTVVVLLWLGGTPRWRHLAYWPLMLATIASLGVLVGGAWIGGEMVYRYGIGVHDRPEPGEAASLPGEEVQAGQLAEVEVHRGAEPARLQYYVPPLQLHMLLIGCALALSVGATGLTLLARPHRPPASAENIVAMTVSTRAATGAWLAAGLLGLMGALAGAWATAGGMGLEAWRNNWQLLNDPAHRRLLAHTLVGIGVLVLLFAPALLARYATLRRGWTTAAAALLILLVSLQLWFGILLLFDGHSGPLFRFLTNE